MLIQLIYCSTARYLLSQQELVDLLGVGRRNNAKVDITGMLLYAEGSFFQVLEGEEQQVERLFETIRKDPRHHRITIIVREPIAARSFSKWRMGFAEITSAEAGALVEAEYHWLRAEGVDLFQGYLLARPAFEQLVNTFYFPE